MPKKAERLGKRMVKEKIFFGEERQCEGVFCIRVTSCFL